MAETTTTTATSSASSSNVAADTTTMALPTKFRNKRIVIGLILVNFLILVELSSFHATSQDQHQQDLRSLNLTFQSPGPVPARSVSTNFNTIISISKKNTKPETKRKAKRIIIKNKRFQQQRQQQQGKTNMTRPAQCGIHYYYHVGKAGGTSVLQWQKKQAQMHPDKVTYLKFYEINAALSLDYQQFKWRRTFRTIDNFVLSQTGKAPIAQKLPPKRNTTATITPRIRKGKYWLTVHHHHRTPGLQFLMPYFQSWKRRLLEHGCDFILSTTLREPMSRTISMMQYIDIDLESFSWFCEHYNSQAHYLLYNSCERRTDRKRPQWCAIPGTANYTKLNDETREELYKYLAKDFDIIGRTDEMDLFIATTELLTGWNTRKTKSLHNIKAPIANRAPRKLSFNITDDMMSLLNASLETDRELLRHLFE